MDPILERYQALEDKVASYTPNLDTKRLYEAFTYADTEHHGQLRKSGEPYIIHRWPTLWPTWAWTWTR